MGGRGSSGPSLGKGGGGKINIVSETDVWSYRHRKGNEPFVDAINTSVRTIEDDFPGVMETVTSVNASTLSGSDKAHTLGYYSPSDKSVSLNDNFTDIDKMNATYDHSVATGFHPPRGNKSGTEAVAFHEMGHALTDHIGKKMGAADIDDAAERIVNAAYKNSRGRGGTKAWAGKISGYAKESYAECVAEAVADWYCNGHNASSQSKSIMSELMKYK